MGPLERRGAVLTAPIKEHDLREMHHMDIKFGFADTARELVIHAEGEREELTQTINNALADNSTLELKDTKGRSYIVRTERVVYVEIGTARAHTVGFAG